MPRTGIRSGRRCGIPGRSAASVASTARGMLRPPRKEHDLHPESGSTGKKPSEGPFTARRTIFAERTVNSPDSPSAPRMVAKKAGSGKPPPAHSGLRENRKYTSRESIRTGPTTENRERMTDGPADTTAGTLKHGPGHGKDQCFTLPRASGLCLYLKTSAKTTPTTRA